MPVEPACVSLIVIAGPVPAFVTAKVVGTAALVALLYKLKLMLRASVVLIVLPLL